MFYSFNSCLMFSYFFMAYFIVSTYSLHFFYSLKAFITFSSDVPTHTSLPPPSIMSCASSTHLRSVSSWIAVLKVPSLHRSVTHAPYPPLSITTTLTIPLHSSGETTFLFLIHTRAFPQPCAVLLSLRVR